MLRFSIGAFGMALGAAVLTAAVSAQTPDRLGTNVIGTLDAKGYRNSFFTPIRLRLPIGWDAVPGWSGSAAMHDGRAMPLVDGLFTRQEVSHAFIFNGRGIRPLGGLVTVGVEVWANRYWTSNVGAFVNLHQRMALDRLRNRSGALVADAVRSGEVTLKGQPVRFADWYARGVASPMWGRTFYFDVKTYIVVVGYSGSDQRFLEEEANPLVSAMVSLGGTS